MKGLAFTLVFALLAAPSLARADDPVVAAAGDIACDPASEFFNGGLGTATRCHQMGTSDLLVGGGLAAVLPLGDNQYENATLSQFQTAYERSWGRVKGVSRPVAGNHEYSVGSGSPTGSGYFDYFNGAGNQTGPAGDRGKGYYSFDVGDWHLVALNSVCEEIGGCGAGSAQEQWLRADLAQSAKSCTLAYWHHPRFTSDPTVANPVSEELFRVLHEAGADVVLNGHAHSYERFAPQDADGAPDASLGIRQFVVGTGGRNLTAFGSALPNSEVRDNTAFGVLTLTLKAGEYDWQFVRESGATGDSGSGACHGAPAAQPPSVATGPATSAGGTSARLNAAVNPRGQATGYRFEYGPTTAYGSTTTATPMAVTTSSAQQVGASVTGLTPGQTYHYRVVAQNGAGTTVGGNRTFTAAASESRYGTAIATTPGLLSHWRLGEANGAHGFDQFALRLGSYRGGHSLGQAGALAGDPDTAVGFDGASGELRTAGPTLTRLASIEGWFMWNSGSSLLRDDSWGGGWALAYEDTGKLAYRVANKRFITNVNIGAVRDGAWHHLVLTKNGGTTVLYLDGEAVHTEGGATNRASTSPWHVMKHGQEAPHAGGRADEIAMYDAVLSPRTVKGHYDIGKGDLTPPQTSITVGPQGPANQTTASFEFTSTEGLSGFRCRLDGPGAVTGAETDCDSPKAYSSLAEGTYTFRVHAIDPAGNPDPTPAARSFTVDTTAPQTTIDSGPTGTVSQASQTFGFSSSEASSTFRCRLDGPGLTTGTEGACQSPKEYAGLADGSYTFTVYAVDAAGNPDATPATRSFTVDTTPPDTSIDSGPSETDTATNAALSFSSPDAVSFECRLDSGDWTACVSPLSLDGLMLGGHTFEVRGMDAAGNADPSPASHTWTIEAAPPPLNPEPPVIGLPAPNAEKPYFAFGAHRPDGYEVVLGSTVKRRSALERLYRDDDRRLVVASAKRRPARHVADVITRTLIADGEREELARLTLLYDGGVSLRGATLSVRIYDYQRRRWVTVKRALRRPPGDRTVMRSFGSDPRSYVSTTGLVRVRVTATSDQPFRTRTDLVRVTTA